MSFWKYVNHQIHRSLSYCYKNSIHLPQPSDFTVIILLNPDGAEHCKYGDILFQPSNDPQLAPIINNSSKVHLKHSRKSSMAFALKKDQVADS